MKTSEFAAALVVVLVAAAAIGGMLFYFTNNNSTNQTGSQTTPVGGQTTQPTYTTTSHTPTYATEGFQETGSVNSVDSAGGHYSIANVALGDPLWITLSANQLSQVQFGEDFEVKVTYTPLGQPVLDTMGKVISVSSSGNCQPKPAGVYSQQPCTTIALLNGNATSSIPSAWNPQVGGQVILALTPETSTPLVVLTGLQVIAVTCSSWSNNQCVNSTSTQQFSAFAQSPTCLQSAFYPSNAPCVYAGPVSQLPISFTFANVPWCAGCNYHISAVATDPGFSVTSVQSNGMGVMGNGVTVSLSIARSDYDGILHLTFYFIPS